MVGIGQLEGSLSQCHLRAPEIVSATKLVASPKVDRIILVLRGSFGLRGNREEEELTELTKKKLKYSCKFPSILRPFPDITSFPYLYSKALRGVLETKT